MKITVDQRGESRVAVARSEGLALSSVQDALDLMATVQHVYDCYKLLLPKKTVCEAFFDLKTGLAGEILQKYTNYGVSVAFVGDFSVYTSNALRDFIYESNKGNRVFFLETPTAALDALHQSR